MQLKSAITVESKTFNNHLGFERGLWQHRSRRFVVVPIRSVFGTVREGPQCGTKLTFDEHDLLKCAAIGIGIAMINQRFILTQATYYPRP
jgi:hypothetical protein